MDRPRPLAVTALAAGLAAVLAACSAAEARSDNSPPNAGPSPGAATAEGLDTTAAPVPVAGPVSPSTAAGAGPRPSGDASVDRRVFVLGDSVLQATSDDYHDTMEPRLERLGWDPTIDAERGRTTAQAERELRRRRDDIGDVVVVLIGHNDPPSARGYRARLEDLLADIEDVHRVLLLTIREFEDDRAALNGVVRSMSRRHPNVEVVEWDDVVAEEDGALLEDQLHLTDDGAELLAAVIADALGPAPRLGGTNRVG